jgi:hypothetical protein
MVATTGLCKCASLLVPSVCLSMSAVYLSDLSVIEAVAFKEARQRNGLLFAISLRGTARCGHVADTVDSESGHVNSTGASC